MQPSTQPYYTMVFLCNCALNKSSIAYFCYCIGTAKGPGLNEQGVVVEETYKETKVSGLEKCEAAWDDPDLGSA